MSLVLEVKSKPLLISEVFESSYIYNQESITRSVHLPCMAFLQNDLFLGFFSCEIGKRASVSKTWLFFIFLVK